MKKVILMLLCVSVLGSFVFAAQNNESSQVQLARRVGVGFNSPILGVSVLAIRYWLTDVNGIEGFLGFDGDVHDDIDKDESGCKKTKYVAGGKFLYVIKSYRKLNVFSSASLALYSVKKTFVIGTGGVGIEWFVLKDLSLSTELGLSLCVGCKTSYARTIAGVGESGVSTISIKYYL